MEPHQITDRSEALAYAVGQLGGASLTAKRFKISPQRVGNWLHRGDNVPFDCALLFQRDAGIRAKVLRPDINWKLIYDVVGKDLKAGIGP